jgi:hypothetical protein
MVLDAPNIPLTHDPHANSFSLVDIINVINAPIGIVSLNVCKFVVEFEGVVSLSILVSVDIPNTSFGGIQGC